MRYKGMFVFLLSTSVFANEFDVENDFLKSLNSINEVATTSKLNRDKTTSLINVLQGKKLEKLGVCNVYEALKYIPGIELTKETSGVMSVIFRGSITKGEVKFMVDGVEINNAYRASYYYFLDLPIELISRIEVLRGPYSILHGSGAISGVINIITKSNEDSHLENEIFLGTGSYNYAKGGTRVNLSDKNYKLSLDAYYQENDKEIDSTDQHLNDYSTGLYLKAYDFELNARLKNSIQGNAYEIGPYSIPDNNKDKYDNKNSSTYVNLLYNSQILKNNELKISLNYSQYAQEIETTNGTIDLASEYKEESKSAKMELINKSFESNKLLVGAKVKRSSALKTDIFGHPTESNILPPNLERDILSVYFYNNYLLYKDMNVDLGLRYDDYSDFGDNTSVDMGLVYRANDDLSYKIKYAHAFRAPSWTELSNFSSGNPDLKAETSKNIEILSVYKHDANSKISLNFYYSVIEDYIQKIDSTTTYTQEDELTLQGAEFDFTYTPKHNIEFDFLASYIDAENKNGQHVDEISNFLTTSSLIYSSDIGLIFGSTLRYKNLTDLNNKAIFDQSISYNYKDINIKLIVKNLFGSDIVYYNSSSIQPIKDADRLVFLKTSLEF